jgi:hypothetical protein
MNKLKNFLRVLVWPLSRLVCWVFGCKFTFKHVCDDCLPYGVEECCCETTKCSRCGALCDSRAFFYLGIIERAKQRYYSYSTMRCTVQWIRSIRRMNMSDEKKSVAKERFLELTNEL